MLECGVIYLPYGMSNIWCQYCGSVYSHKVLRGETSNPLILYLGIRPREATYLPNYVQEMC
jgi:hypothetical protein